MTTNDFKKVARLLKQVYAELEHEALEEGIDIFSDDFLRVRDALRLEVLKRMGFTLEEYREAKELVAPAKRVDVTAKLNELTESVENLVIPEEEDLLEKAKEIAEAVVKPPVIQNQIVERTTVEKPVHTHTTVKETVNEEFDPSPIYKELELLKEKVAAIKTPEPFDPKGFLDELRSEFEGRFEENINVLGMPDFRKLAMGLQAQIDAIDTSGESGGAVWGEITGTLSNQTDLVVELDGIREQSIAFAIAL
jgi:hypothetical protein